MDCSDPERERIYTRPVAAERLIDAGETVDRKTWEHVIRTGAAGMLHLLARKNALPRTLSVLAALGDDAAVRARREEKDERDNEEGLDERIVIGRALMSACRFRHAGVALRLLERAVALDPDLGRRIDRWQGRQAFVEFLISIRVGCGNDQRRRDAPALKWTRATATISPRSAVADDEPCVNPRSFTSRLG
jgi:hypothetical protein